MKLSRLFDATAYKGTEKYLDTQKIYELVRTIILFGISLSLYLAGYIQTKQQANLLTIVAVLGCLPASKSLVSFIMFARYRSCSKDTAEQIKQHIGSLQGVYDCVFTSYKINFDVDHLTVCGNILCGYSEKKDFPEQEFQKHLSDILKLDGHKDLTIKIFTQLNKYLDRLDQMQELEQNESQTIGILESVKNITL